MTTAHDFLQAIVTAHDEGRPYGAPDVTDLRAAITEHAAVCADVDIIIAERDTAIARADAAELAESQALASRDEAYQYRDEHAAEARLQKAHASALARELAGVRSALVGLLAAVEIYDRDGFEALTVAQAQARTALQSPAPAPAEPAAVSPAAGEVGR